MPNRSRAPLILIVIVFLAVAILSAGCTSSPNPPATPVSTQTAAPAAGINAVIIQDFTFSPASLTVKAGTTVVWTNHDSTVHQIGSDTGSPVSFSSGSIANGATFQFTFTDPGTYNYHCIIHPSMKGTVVVT